MCDYKTEWFYSEPNTVICDLCNRDCDELDEGGKPFMGGALIGSYAVCPVCLERIKKNPDYNPGEIEFLDIEVPFADNVRAYRMKVQGNTDLVMEHLVPAEDVSVRVNCPYCKGKKHLELRTFEVGKGQQRPFTAECFVCKGAGFLSMAEYLDFLEVQSAFCSCGNPSGLATYHEEDVQYYTCNDCGGIVQIG